MSTFTVWKFDTPNGAELAESKLQGLQSQELIKVLDAATVSWPAGAKKPKTKQLHSAKAAGALGGSFWGLLFGLLFFIPILGLAMGAALGALSGSLAHIGIDEDFINQVRSEITPGTSALFVMTSDAVLDKVRDAFAGEHMELISANVSEEQEAKLREAFGED